MNGNERVTKVLRAAPLSVFKDRRNARAVGEAMYEQDWSRRSAPHLLQLRFDYWQDAGGTFLDYYGDLFAIEEDLMDRLVDDPSCKWFSAFPKRCMEGPLLQTVSLKVQRRLQVIELGLRTPPVGYAI